MCCLPGFAWIFGHWLLRDWCFEVVLAVAGFPGVVVCFKVELGWCIVDCD